MHAVLGGCAALVVALLLTEPAGAYDFQPLAAGFDQPVYATTAPDDPATVYVVERPGDVQILRDGRRAGDFLDIRSQVWSDGEGGLLSIAFHPRFAQNHLVYADYTALDHSTHVVEYTVSGGVAVPSSARTLLVVPQPYPNHKGGQLQFDPRGRLYVGMGDGGSNAGSPLNDPDNRGQNPATRLGKLLRTDPVSGTGWQVIGSGLRNPWRFSFDRLTGSLWLGDVGAGTFEELDVRPAAKLDQAANYGWSRYEGPAFYNQKVKLRGKGALVAPILAYTHQSGGCSIVGGYVYRGAQVAQAQGRYFFGDYCTGSIWSFPAKLGLRSHAASIVRRNDGYVQDLVSFGEGADGTLYAVSIDGGVYVLGQ